MKGHLTLDTPAPAPATAIWEAYRGIELGRLVSELLGDVIGKAEVVEGDGGVGTIMKFTFPPGTWFSSNIIFRQKNGKGTPGVVYMKEIFTKMDEVNRVKETEVFEGGVKPLGFDSYRFKLEIIEKDDWSSIIRSSIEYEILDETKNDIASHATLEPLEIIAKTIGKYVAEKK